MAVLGLRCYKDAIAHVVLDGTRDAPVIMDHGHAAMPNDPRPRQLTWLRNEVLELLDRTQVTSVGFKAPEPSAPTRDLQRAEAEGVLQEACIAGGYDPIRRTKSQLKSDLGYEGKAKYVHMALPGNLAQLPEKQREAALVALALLPDA